jgi:hypothetical protein
MPTIDSEAVSAAGGLAGLIAQLSDQPGIDPKLVAHLTAARGVLLAKDRTKRPFLTVILRTQGKRIEPLKDALLCLAGQTDQDFDVVVLAHDAEPGPFAEVSGVISRLESGFAARLKLVEVQGGTRAHPLNVGLDNADGSYVAFYDDDDLVFANWVEEFHRAAEGADGRLLRSLVANQSLMPEVWPNGANGFRTTSWPKLEHPVRFDQIEHLLVNRSPFMSWAFPRELFTVIGVRFDEELTVCEDWDVIVRGSLLCGVKEIESLTSIYRRWQGGDSSYDVHSAESWQWSEQRVLKRIDESTMLLPPGSLGRVRQLALAGDTWDKYHYLFKGNSLRQPLQSVWNLAMPPARLMRRVVRRYRRGRAS